MSNFEVPIVRITDVKPLEGSDFLSVIYFRGFGVISAKLEDGSHRYSVGDLVVYCPQDSLIPEYLLKQGFYSYDVVRVGEDGISEFPVTNTTSPALPKLLDTSFANTIYEEDGVIYKTLSTGKGMLDGKDGSRVKPRKLRGFLSEGIMYPTHSEGIGEIVHDCCLDNEKGELGYFCEGDDVAEFLSITKYEPPIPVGMSGDVAYIGTNIIPHFDIENIKKYPDILNSEEEVIVTEKLHGTFFGIGYVPGLNNPDLWDSNFFCYSKGLGSRGLVFKNSETNTNNLYVRQFLKLLPYLKNEWNLTKPYFILGEIFGKGVQDLDYSAKEPEFRIFDHYCDGWFDWNQIEVNAKELGVKTVPVLFKGKYKDYDAESKNGLSTLAKHVREGVVIKPVIARYVDGFGRVILKDINDRYLTRKGGTEFQ